MHVATTKADRVGQTDASGLTLDRLAKGDRGVLILAF